MRTLAVVAFCLYSAGTLQLHAAEAVDYEKQVLPILQKKCFSCHGEKKAKSKLRLHTAADAVLGGKSKKAIVPGKPGESGLIARISLPTDDDDVMPPEDEDQAVTKAEVEILRTWIAEGAKYPEGAAPAKKKVSPGTPLTDADEKKLDSIRKAGARAMRVAQDVNWLTVSFRPAAAKTGDEVVALVKGLKNITELNLAGTKVSDGGLANITGLSNLARLHLERTTIQGSGLAHLKGLSKLEYLNLYGTAIDDTALANLSDLKSLKKIYLWQTKVTDAGVEALKKANPELYVNRGVDPPAKVHPETASKPDGNKPDAAKPNAPKKIDPKNLKTAKVVVAASSDGWLYVSQKDNTGDAWIKDGFDASKWTKGKTPIGYGEPAVAEKKGSALKLEGQNILLLRSFDLEEASLKEAKGVRLQVASDNSAVVWVNGKQIDNDNENHEPKYWNRTVHFAADVLKKGKNVVAVQLNNNEGSSDAFIDLQLETLKN